MPHITVVKDMTKAEANVAIREIRDLATDVEAKITRLHDLIYDFRERNGHTALGFSNWQDCVREHVPQLADKSTTHLKNLLKSGRISNIVENADDPEIKRLVGDAPVSHYQTLYEEGIRDVQAIKEVYELAVGIKAATNSKSVTALMLREAAEAYKTGKATGTVWADDKAAPASKVNMVGSGVNGFSEAVITSRDRLNETPADYITYKAKGRLYKVEGNIISIALYSRSQVQALLRELEVADAENRLPSISLSVARREDEEKS